MKIEELRKTKSFRAIAALTIGSLLLVVSLLFFPLFSLGDDRIRKFFFAMGFGGVGLSVFLLSMLFFLEEHRIPASRRGLVHFANSSWNQFF